MLLPVVILDTSRGSGSVCRRVISCLEQPFQVLTESNEFLSALRPRSVGVVCLESLSHTGLELSRLRTVSTCAVGCPVFLVLPLTAEIARTLAETALGHWEVVWLEELEDRLALRIAAAQSRDEVAILLGDIADLVAPPPLVQSALTLIADAEPPLASVIHLARRLGVSPKTLRYHWSESLGWTITPKELLEWTALLRAVEAAHMPPRMMARRAGVHERTLERMCHRRLGVSLGAVRRRGWDFVLRVFQARLEEVLV